MIKLVVEYQKNQIRLKNQTQVLIMEANFNVRPHPDHLALIACLQWGHQWLPKTKISFAHKISADLAYSLAQAPFYWLTDQIDYNLAIYQGANRPGLTFSGGFDSLAVVALLPDQLYFYHASSNHDQIVKLGRKILGDHLIVVKTNCKSLNSEQGWPSWPSVLIPNLLLANSFKLGYLGLGGNLGSVFLKGGREYHASHLKRSRWYALFEQVGVPIFCPLAGVSEVGVVKILHKSHKEWLDMAIYCQKKVGQNCHQCAKCMRRQAVYQKVVYDQTVTLDLKLFKTLGPSLLWLINNSCAWVTKYYPKAELVQPVALRALIKELISNYLEDMNELEISQLENFGKK